MDLRILEIATNTENNKVLDKHTHKSKNKNPICGDEMEISLLIKNNKVIDIGYQCKSCIYCQASVILLSLNIKKFQSQVFQQQKLCFPNLHLLLDLLEDVPGEYLFGLDHLRNS